MTARDLLASPLVAIYGAVAVWWLIGKRGRRRARAVPDALADRIAWAWSGLTWRRRWRRTPQPSDPHARLLLKHVAGGASAGVTAAELHAALGWPLVDVYAVLDALVDGGHLTACSVPGPGTPRRVYRIPEARHG